MYGTLAQEWHRFDHAIGEVRDVLLTTVPTDLELAMLRQTWQGRLGLWWRRLTRYLTR